MGHDWFLDPGERGNADTDLDARHESGLSWTAGNTVRPLVHGAVYFRELLAAIRATGTGDLIMFTDWRGDPDELLDGPDTEVSAVLCAAASRGVLVRGLIWRSHLDRFRFSASENRHLGDEIEAAGGECLLDMRVRSGGSHHQKMVVLRHRDRPERDVAYVGGIDLCHSRGDDDEHGGDGQPQPITSEYGATPPWHDIQLEIRGPAVGDIEATFRERWDDPAPLSRSLFSRLRDLVQGEDTYANPLPAQRPDPPSEADGGTERLVQVLRTYPYRRKGYPFATAGERSIARGYAKALRAARSFVYLEDQYLWSEEVVASLAEALATRPDLRFTAIVPLHPDQGGLSGAAQIVGRAQALAALRAAGGDRVAIYGPENHQGTPVYVHAKACVIDDTWTCVGSDNVNLRSWTHDSELSCAVLDGPGVVEQDRFGRRLRLRLAREHLDRDDGDDADLLEPVSAFDAFRACADRLDAWYAGGRRGPRPPGRLRTYRLPSLSAIRRPIASLLYRTIADPEGRPASLRRTRAF